MMNQAQTAASGMQQTVGPYDEKSVARRRTVKAFRRFLDQLDIELGLYGRGTRQHPLTALIFQKVRRAVRGFRDESHRSHEVILIAALDIVAVWCAWVSQNVLTAPERKLHETLARMVQGIIKGWRTYMAEQQLLPDPPIAAPKPQTSTEAING